MDKILLIIKREYLVRVRKKSFLIMTILGPLLMGALMVIPAYLTLNSAVYLNGSWSYNNSAHPFPMWLPAGTIVSSGNNVTALSVIEFIE